MNKLLYLFPAASMLLLAVSCSVKEDRTVCPCFLSLKVLSQNEGVFSGGKAWCNVFDGEGAVLAWNSLSGMDRRDTLLTFDISPRRRISAVVANRLPGEGSVKASPGEEFCPLYAFSKEMDCLQEEACDSICFQNKQYCTLKVQLEAAAVPMAEDIVLKVSAPFCGIDFPSLRATKGEYSCSARFDAGGVALIRIPRQDGEGLSLSVDNPGRFSSVLNLYEVMKSSDYDWERESLDDFSVTLNIDSVSGQCAVLDWKLVETGSYEF